MERGGRFSRLERAPRQGLRLPQGLRCCAPGLWEPPAPRTQWKKGLSAGRWGVLSGLCQACSNVPPHSDSVPPSGLGLLPAPGPSQGPLRVQNPMQEPKPLCVGRGVSQEWGGRSKQQRRRVQDLEVWPSGSPGGPASGGCTLCQLPSPRDPCGPSCGRGQNPAAGPGPARPATAATSGLTPGSAGQRRQRQRRRFSPLPLPPGWLQAADARPAGHRARGSSLPREPSLGPGPGLAPRWSEEWGTGSPGGRMVRPWSRRRDPKSQARSLLRSPRRGARSRQTLGLCSDTARPRTHYFFLNKSN